MRHIDGQKISTTGKFRIASFPALGDDAFAAAEDWTSDPQPAGAFRFTQPGAGGKSLHLAALMENKGQVIALDIYQNKLNELKRRAKRNGAHNIETRWIENSKTIREHETPVKKKKPCRQKCKI